jgi:preprotein translocase subunit SecG
MERTTGILPAFFITMFVHITIVFPLITSKKQDENS